MAGRKRNRADDLLELTPTEDFKDPGKRVSGGKKQRTYTSGTLYEKEAGQYSTPGMSGSLDKIYSHGKRKNFIAGKTRVEKGEKVKEAKRGVGQESIDGFISGNPKYVAKTAMKNRKKPPRRR